MACKWGAECRKWKAGTCAYGHGSLDFDLDSDTDILIDNETNDDISDSDDEIISNPNSNPNSNQQSDDEIEDEFEPNYDQLSDGTPGSPSSDYYDGVSEIESYGDIAVLGDVGVRDGRQSRA